MSLDFDRPVFIVAAPRSCSTLLFETLGRSARLYSPGDESHGIFEGHLKLSPMRGAVDSNRLEARLLDAALARSIRERFGRKLRDREGRPVPAGSDVRVRMLEKTPKNSLRIPFLDALFPDALFIHLVRDPLPNLGSIIDAWQSGRFVTYPRIRTAHGPWSLLLPLGWQGLCNSPLADIAAFQWCSAHQYVMEDLAQIDPRRWTAVHVEDLLAEPMATIVSLCNFMDVEPDTRLLAHLAGTLPLSRYTLTPPEAGKWRRHATELQRVWPAVSALLPTINDHLAGRTRAVSTASP